MKRLQNRLGCNKSKDHHSIFTIRIRLLLQDILKILNGKGSHAQATLNLVNKYRMSGKEKNIIYEFETVRGIMKYSANTYSSNQSTHGFTKLNYSRLNFTRNSYYKLNCSILGNETSHYCLTIEETEYRKLMKF